MADQELSKHFIYEWDFNNGTKRHNYVPAHKLSGVVAHDCNSDGWLELVIMQFDYIVNGCVFLVKDSTLVNGQLKDTSSFS